ncbi:TonB-dependent receptor [Tenuifilaceae bacterium CYCD]|nr:TonB-dependent receptor [Tenuifilaceae bacterium CYCD]
MKRLVFIVALTISHTISLSAQEQDSTVNWDILNLSLNDLMNMEVSVASKQAAPLRESPGIVTVINEQEILNSGARDLIDILRLVPTFDFGTEWDNIIGLGVRGNNATEGKFLILYDGHQLNETNFGSFPFGHHILVNNISKIEIIRGPGSVMYGGSAELAVINIISKKNNQLNGLDIAANYGYSKGGTIERNVQGALSKKFRNGLEIDVSAYYGRANRSNRKIETLDTSRINYKDSSRIVTSNISTNISYRSLNLQFLYDSYLLRNTEFGGSVLFETYSGLVDYSIKLGDKLSVKPLIGFKQMNPWYFINFDDKRYYNTTNHKIFGNIGLSYQITDNLNLFFGIENNIDKSQKTLDTVTFQSTNKNHLSYNNYTAFGEVQYNTKIVNINAGARIENHSIYGSAFVPRIALTKSFKKFHFKILYSKAYKAPTISNIDYNKNIKPEYTTVYELETGYQITNDMNVVVNFFDIIIKDPILYIPNPVTGADYYKNFDKTGTKGFELSYKLKKDIFFANINYSYYAKNKNTIDAYNVEGHNNTYGAFPQHKLSFQTSIDLTKKLTFNATANFFGNRYTYIHSDRDWTPKLVEYKAFAILNANILYKGLFVKDLDLMISVYDVTNQDYEFINAYQGLQNQIPSAGREFAVKLYLKIN